MPPAVKDALAAAIDALRHSIADARWVPRGNLHLTLRFLGEVPEERIAAISDGVGACLGGMVDFTTSVEGLGAFPSDRRARVLWAGLADPTGGFAALAEAVGEAMDALGFPAEGRPFRAHVTLARLRVPASVALGPVERIRFTVDRVTLMRSRLGRPAPRYEALATFPFRRSPGPPRPE